MNVHGLKQKHKNMTGKLKFYYEEKRLVEKRLLNLNHLVSTLEKAKNNCAKQIRARKKE